SKVGSLEFRILANEFDDGDAIRDARTEIEKLGPKLAEYAKQGLPPPGPTKGGKEQYIYKVRLARGENSHITYSWVELGPTERQQLNLDNAAEHDPNPYRSKIWNQARSIRTKGTADFLKDSADRKLLNGALFYSRRCEDRNIPEEERKKKAYE